MRMTRLLLPALAVSVLAMPVAAPARAGCDEAFAAVGAALQAGDLAAAQAAYRDQAPACPGDARARLGRSIAQTMFNMAVSAAPADEAMLQALQSYGRVWQASATLGDLALARKDYETAAAQFQLALLDIEEAPAEETIARDVILGIRRKAEEAQLLSPVYDPSPRGRDGSNAGLASWSFRGSAVRARALPIEFMFDSAAFTEKGQAAADDLVRQILNPVTPPPARIVFEGHTDPKGSDSYNMDLSMRRAQVLKAYVEQSVAAELARAGRTLDLEIVAVGKGKREQYEPYDPSLYTEEQLHQLSRRVVILRGD